MNISTELDKLVDLRDNGDLTQAEFESAKAKLLAETGSGLNPEPGIAKSIANSKVVTGVVVALGLFVGNILYFAISGGSLQKGIGVGAIAAVLILLLYFGMAVLKGKQ